MPHPQPLRGHPKQPRKTPFTRNPLGAFLTCFPPARVAGRWTKTWRVSAVPFEATSENMPHLPPSLATRNSLEKHPSLTTLLGLSSPVFLQRGSRGVGQKLGGCQQCSLHPTSCLRHEAFKCPYANFALLRVNPQVDKMQCKVDTPTALYSRLLKAGGWPQKLLLTRSKFRTTSRDPR